MTLSKSFLSLYSVFFLWWNWVSLERTAEYFSSLFCFLSFFFLGVTGSVRIRQQKISRHYFCSFLFFVSFFGVTGSTRIRQLNISRHFFVLFLFSFFGVTGSARIRLLNISRHYFVFLLFSFFFSSLSTILRAG